LNYGETIVVFCGFHSFLEAINASLHFETKDEEISAGWRMGTICIECNLVSSHLRIQIDKLIVFAIYLLECNISSILGMEGKNYLWKYACCSASDDRALFRFLLG